MVRKKGESRSRSRPLAYRSSSECLWSEMGLLSKIHALAMQKKSREGLSLSAIEQPSST